MRATGITGMTFNPFYPVTDIKRREKGCEEEKRKLNLLVPKNLEI